MKANSLFVIALCLLTLLASSCKKEYSCVCGNPANTYTAFTVKDTQKKAEKKCVDYYNENFASVPMSETFCQLR